MVKKVQGYTLFENIGKGSSGEVFRATHIQKQGQFAIKVIQNQLLIDNPKTYQCLVNQVKVLSKIGPCQNIVSFYQLIRSRNCHYFIYEYCNGGNLQQKLKNMKTIPQNEALQYIKNIVCAYKILNKFKVMHRDLKPENILFHNGQLKLADFGFCKGFQPEQYMTKTMLGSPIYMAPEILKGLSYTSKADIWSLGIILFQMLYGYCPYHSNSIANLASKIQTNPLQLPQIPIITSKTKQLLKKMLMKDQFKRMSWIELFNEFLNNNQCKFFSQKSISLEPNANNKQKINKNNQYQINEKQKISFIDKLKQNDTPEKQNKIKFNSAKYLLYLSKSEQFNFSNEYNVKNDQKKEQLLTTVDNFQQNQVKEKSGKQITDKVNNSNNKNNHNSNNATTTTTNNNNNILRNCQSNQSHKQFESIKHNNNYHSSKKLINCSSLQHFFPKSNHTHHLSIDRFLNLTNNNNPSISKIAQQYDSSQKQIKQFTFKLQKLHYQFVQFSPNCQTLIHTKNKQNLTDVLEYLKTICKKLNYFAKKFEKIKKQCYKDHDDIQLMMKYEIQAIQQTTNSIQILNELNNNQQKRKEGKNNQQLQENLLGFIKFTFKNLNVDKANDNINQIWL